jgi:hypothetical protein
LCGSIMMKMQCSVQSNLFWHQNVTLWVVCRGYGLVNAFIDHLHTPLGTQVITALSLISTIHKSPPSSSLLCLHQLFPNNSFWQLPTFRSYLHSLPCRT